MPLSVGQGPLTGNSVCTQVPQVQVISLSSSPESQKQVIVITVDPVNKAQPPVDAQPNNKEESEPESQVESGGPGWWKMNTYRHMLH